MNCPKCGEAVKTRIDYQSHAGSGKNFKNGQPSALYHCGPCDLEFEWRLGEKGLLLFGDADDSPPNAPYDHDETFAGLRWIDRVYMDQYGDTKQYSAGYRDDLVNWGLDVQTWVVDSLGDLYRPEGDDPWEGKWK